MASARSRTCLPQWDGAEAVFPTISASATAYVGSVLYGVPTQPDTNASAREPRKVQGSDRSCGEQPRLG